ncbi:hypothetical protein LPJ81_004980 [Coemansia sp. IMI 209127]|nr:hypothetical protein LPJ81_004980 [Coemansia sp. IMI 209127]
MALAGTTKVYIFYYTDANQEFIHVSERLTAPVAATFDFASLATCYSSQPNAVCLGQWVVPENLVPGNTYHFVWFWYYPNPVGQWYSTCFDMNIQDLSHVVGTADMATLLKKGNPPDDYDYGFNAEASSLITEVTALPKNAATSSSTITTSTTSIVTPTPHITSSAADIESTTFYVADKAAELPESVEASEVGSLIPFSHGTPRRKCRPRPRN